MIDRKKPIQSKRFLLFDCVFHPINYQSPIENPEAVDYLLKFIATRPYGYVYCVYNNLGSDGQV